MRRRRPRRRRRWKPVLRPRAGRRLPRELRAARVGRLARELPLGLDDPGFEVLLRRIDEGPVHQGNQVEVFTRGEDAFAAMRRAIGEARREVLVESYIWRDDATGQAFLDDLGAAVGRGARVRALADALGSFATRDDFWADLERRGIEAHLYNPLLARLWLQLYRDHRKLLVIDREVAFTGGMNIGEEYGSYPLPAWKARRARGATRTKRELRDTHLRVTGPVAWEMAVVFSEGWLRSAGAPFEIEPLDAAAEEADGARVLVLDARPNRGYGEAAAVLAAIVAAARERVWITNAYFAPRSEALPILGAAVARGVDVRLLLPGRTDVPLVRHAGHGYFRELLARGVRIFEYQAAILHAKSLVADGRVSVVGSTNLDFRSFHFNAECNLVVLDRETGRHLEAAFEEDLTRSEEITAQAWARRPALHKAGDRAARWLSPLL